MYSRTRPSFLRAVALDVLAIAGQCDVFGHAHGLNAAVKAGRQRAALLVTAPKKVGSVVERLRGPRARGFAGSSGAEGSRMWHFADTSGAVKTRTRHFVDVSDAEGRSGPRVRGSAGSSLATAGFSNPAIVATLAAAFPAALFSACRALLAADLERSRA